MDTCGKVGTERRCALTRTVLPTDRLIRFVRDPEGAVVPDLRRRLPGRGVWIEARRSSVDEAGRRNVFSRALKSKVWVSDRLGAELDDLLTERTLAALSIANKAGQIVTGYQKTETLLGAGRGTILLQARDGAEDGTGRLGRKADAIGVPRIRIFSISQMSLALGRANVVHAAGMKHPAVDAFLAETSRLVYYREAKNDLSVCGGGCLLPFSGANEGPRPDVL